MAFGSFLLADALPFLSEKPWLGCWIGYEEKEFDYSITAKDFYGTVSLKEKTKDGWKRISEQRVIKLNYLVEEERGGKWQRRSIEPDSFETTQGASDEAESFEVVATYKGGTKLKVSHEIDGKEVMISVAIVETESSNPIRAAVDVIIPDLYKLKEGMEERELKKKLKGDEVRLKTVAGKKVKFDLYEEINLATEKGLEEGVLEFSLECKNFAEKLIILSSEVEKTGKIFFRQKGVMNEGFTATWYPEEIEEGKPTPKLVFRVK